MPIVFEAQGQRWVPVWGARVRVLRMIQGPAAESLVLRPGTITSCDRPVGNGATGIIVGAQTGSENGVPTIYPVSVPVSTGRLLDGEPLPFPPPVGGVGSRGESAPPAPGE